ncbi:MAG: DUF507 family protein [Deltaproteobacteria bacterium]|nr:DUF507 family protein [Deltaproteobacteria bacterium]
MRISEAASSHLAHRILEALEKKGGKVHNDRAAQTAVKRTLTRHLDQDPRIHQAVVRRIASLSRRPPEGSSEYDVLYRQYYEQEQRKNRP